MSLSLLLILCVLNEVQILKMACHLRGRRKKYLRGHLEKEVFPKEVMVIQYGKQKKKKNVCYVLHSAGTSPVWRYFTK